MSKNIYVGNLSFDTTSDDLRDTCSPTYGTVTRAQVATDRDTGRSRGFGFVEMSDGGDEAIAALNGTTLEGRTPDRQRGQAPHRTRPPSPGKLQPQLTRPPGLTDVQTAGILRDAGGFSLHGETQS